MAKGQQKQAGNGAGDTAKAALDTLKRKVAAMDELSTKHQDEIRRSSEDAVVKECKNIDSVAKKHHASVQAAITNMSDNRSQMDGIHASESKKAESVLKGLADQVGGGGALADVQATLKEVMGRLEDVKKKKLR